MVCFPSNPKSRTYYYKSPLIYLVLGLLCWKTIFRNNGSILVSPATSTSSSDSTPRGKASDITDQDDAKKHFLSSSSHTTTNWTRPLFVLNDLDFKNKNDDTVVQCGWRKCFVPSRRQPYKYGYLVSRQWKYDLQSLQPAHAMAKTLQEEQQNSTTIYVTSIPPLTIRPSRRNLPSLLPVVQRFNVLRRRQQRQQQRQQKVINSNRPPIPIWTWNASRPIHVQLVRFMDPTTSRILHPALYYQQDPNVLATIKAEIASLLDQVPETDRPAFWNQLAQDTRHTIQLLSKYPVLLHDFQIFVTAPQGKLVHFDLDRVYGEVQHGEPSRPDWKYNHTIYYLQQANQWLGVPSSLLKDD